MRRLAYWIALFITAVSTSGCAFSIYDRSISGPASSNTLDHLILISGNDQSASAGSALSPLRVQALMANGAPYTGGLALTLQQIMGIDSNMSGSLTVTTDSLGYAQFTASLGYMGNDEWEVLPASVTLPDIDHTGGTKVIFSADVTTSGNGTFAAASEFDGADFSSDQPQYPVAADFNGDGKMDVAFTVPGASSVMAVLLGNGDGTFGTGTSYTTPSDPEAIVVGDFDHDGKLDIAVVCQGGKEVSIFLGNGDGTFKTRQDYSLPAGSPSLALGDFNHDGNLDIVTGNYILLGNGDGTFQTAVSTGYSGGNVGGVAVGDFNKDGKLDLAVSDYNNGKVDILLGNGDGTFQSPVSYNTPHNGEATIIVSADFNGDGNSDLAVAEVDILHPANGVAIFLGNGDGTFQAATSYGVATQAPEMYGLAIGDINADGKIDLVSTDWNSNEVVTFLGNGDGTFQTPTTYGLGSNVSAFGVALGDFNGDGKLDIIECNENSFSNSTGGCEILTGD